MTCIVQNQEDSCAWWSVQSQSQCKPEDTGRAMPSANVGWHRQSGKNGSLAVVLAGLRAAVEG